MPSVETAQSLALTDWLAQRRRPMLVSHRRPDGDAIGALSVLEQALRRRGMQAQPVLFEPFPQRYALLRDASHWRLWDELTPVDGAGFDALVILDTCSFSQLEPIRDFLSSAPPTLVIDHHATTDAIGLRSGDLRIIDPAASATCLMLSEWLLSAGTIDAAAATALLTGIGTDCGWFRFSNTDARTLRAAARLAESGADVHSVYSAIYQQDSLPKLKLIARVLDSLELHAGGLLAVMTLRQADFDATGADRGMTEDLVNEAGRLGGPEAIILFTQEPDGSVRINFRSKRGLDVAALAQKFGGGGHHRAAGARMQGDWHTVVQDVVSETAAQLRNGAAAASTGRAGGGL